MKPTVHFFYINKIKIDLEILREPIFYFLIFCFSISCESSKDSNSNRKKVFSKNLVSISIDYTNFKIKEYEIRSKTLILNGKNCFWRIKMPISNKKNQINRSLELVNVENQNIIHTHKNFDLFDSESNKKTYNNPNFDSLSNEVIKDVNFDRNRDLIFLSHEESGSSGKFYKVYLFDELTENFCFSKELSGYNVELDNEKKVLKKFGKNGYAYLYKSKTFFNKNGSIKCVEVFMTEPLKNDLFKVSYQKINNGKISATKAFILTMDEFHKL